MPEEKKHNILKLKLNNNKNTASVETSKPILEPKIEILEKKQDFKAPIIESPRFESKDHNVKTEIEEKSSENKTFFRGMPQIIESPRNKTTVFSKPNNFRSRNVPRETNSDQPGFRPYNRNPDFNNQEQRFTPRFNNNNQGNFQRPFQRSSTDQRFTPRFNQGQFQGQNQGAPQEQRFTTPRFNQGQNQGPQEQRFTTPRFTPGQNQGSSERPFHRPRFNQGANQEQRFSGPPRFGQNNMPDRKYNNFPNQKFGTSNFQQRTPGSFTPREKRFPYTNNQNFDPTKPNYNKPRFDGAQPNNRPPFNVGRSPTGPSYNDFAKKQDTYTDRKKKREYDEKTRTRPLDTGKDINVTEFVGRVDANHLETHAFRESFSRRKLSKDKQKNNLFIKRNIEIFGPMSIKDIAAKMAMRSDEVLSIARKLGLDTNEKKNIIEDNLHIIIEECGHTPIRVDEQNKAKLEFPIQQNVDSSSTKARAPIVVVVGHVDHGKTSLLDCIRKSGVAKKEAGGITQNIGAYQVKTPNGAITFIDTPGHEAFTQMRANGVQVTDIAILVVSAEDGVKPQTLEAITHIQSAKVPIIVAMTKCDLPTANLEKVKAELLAHSIVPEEYGGEVPCIPVSSVTGKNIDELLKSILLQAEIMELKANEESNARGVVLESRLDPKIGPVATLLVQEGTLKTMNYCIADISSGKIKAMRDSDGKIISQATPSMPVEVIGFDITPKAGSKFANISNMKLAEEILSARRLKHDQENKSVGMSLHLENFSNSSPTINLILRAETQGLLEALKVGLLKLNNEKSEINLILSGVGAIKESDIDLAVISNAEIVGFKTKTSQSLLKQAEDKKIKIIEDAIIYNLIDEIESQLLNLIKPEEQEVLIGIARIQQIFNSSKLGNIAGCIVTSGLIKNGMIAKIMRKDKLMTTTKIESLKRNKDNVKEVANGLECGIVLNNFDSLNIGDEIHCFKIELVPHK